MLFFDLVLLFSYRISHSYARSSFSRLQREVTLHFHFCQFFIISALVLEPLFRHLYTGKPKLWTHMKITFFFDIFAFFRWILLFFFHFGAPYLASVERRVEIYDSHSNSTFLRFWRWILRFLIDFSPFFNEIYACFITFLTPLMNHLYTGALFFARSNKVRPFVSTRTIIPRFLMLFWPHGSTGVCFCNSSFWVCFLFDIFTKTIRNAYFLYEHGWYFFSYNSNIFCYNSPKFSTHR